MKLKHVLKGFKPLVVTDEGIIVSKFNRIFLMTDKFKLQTVCNIEDNIYGLFFDYFPLLFRMRRSGVNSACKYDNTLFFCYKGSLFSYENFNGKVHEELSFNKGRGPLTLTSIKNLPGFKDCVAFGEYFGNPSKEEVRVFRKLKGSKWEVVFNFKLGEVNHIHNIIPDYYRKCVWILTGDYGNSASIYKATFDFERVELVVGGDQKYRACVAFPTEKGLLYATDTQLSENAVRMLTLNGDDWVSEKLSNLNGSCICGCETKSYFVFSTSTEPNSMSESKILGWLDNKPGPGIRFNRSEVLVCSKNDFRIETVYSREKDFWPYRLFQFGTIAFPAGKNPTDNLYAYNVGSKVNDLSLEIWDLNDE